MKAVCWHGSNDAGGYGTDQNSQPARCNCQNYVNSDLRFDLHLYDGYIPTMEKGDILGHEFMGEVVEVGSLSKCKDRRSRCVPLLLPATAFSAKDLSSLCDNLTQTPG